MLLKGLGMMLLAVMKFPEKGLPEKKGRFKKKANGSPNYISL